MTQRARRDRENCPSIDRHKCPLTSSGVGLRFGGKGGLDSYDYVVDRVCVPGLKFFFTTATSSMAAKRYAVAV